MIACPHHQHGAPIFLSLSYAICLTFFHREGLLKAIESAFQTKEEEQILSRYLLFSEGYLIWSSHRSTLRLNHTTYGYFKVLYSAHLVDM